MEPVTKRRKLSNEGEHAEDKDNPATGAGGRNSLFVRSLPASVTTERLVEHFSQSYPLKHATVILDPTTKVSRGFGFVTFTDAEDAKQAIAEFNDSVLEGRKIKVEAAEARHRDVVERVDGGKTVSKNAKGEELRAARQQGKEDVQPPKLIVRNLPWSIKTADDLTKLFLSYGKVKHAVVPKLPSKKDVQKDTQAGFGIVIIRGKKNAERALQGVNGKVVDGRTLAVDWAVDKETWQKVQKGELEQPQAEEQATTQPDAEQAVTSEDDEDEDAGADIDEELDEADAASDVSEDDSINDDTALDPEDADLDASDISSLAASSSSPTTTNASKFNTENTTIFIRNLAYDTTDDDLYTHCTESFGPVRYARVVYDPETERSRGTAFVCFRAEDTAKSCVSNCPKPDTPASTTASKTSLLQNTSADPSGKYTLAERLLHITRALPKTEADRRTSENKSQRLEKQAADKRRLYLLSEGTVSPSSSLYHVLSKTDLDVRAASAKQRQSLVKSNPNLGLSLTRLSVRNLPRWVDGKALKALAREAIVGFASDVKQGLREAISKEELARGGEEARAAEQERKKAGKGVVRQAKIVYESENTGSKVGEGKGGRSRGYGFIEYWAHRSALMGLRWMNGHLVKKPDGAVEDGEKGKRLIVEFAIENAQVVQRRGDRERRVKERNGRGEGGAWREGNGDRQFGPRGGSDDRKRGPRDWIDRNRGPRDRNERSHGPREGGDRNRGPRDGNDRNRGPRDGKRKRDEQDVGNGPARDAKKQKKDSGLSQDEKNKVAARNRIIAQKRQKRKNRKG